MPKNKVNDPITDQEIAFARPVGREQVLNRLWELANLSPEMTRGSITGQVKALSMIVDIQNFIPGRRTALSPEKKSVPGLAPGSAADAPPNPGSSHSTFAKSFTPSEAPPLPLYVPLFSSIPPLGTPLPAESLFVRPR